MANFKIYSTKFFCNTKVAGLGGIFMQPKLLCIWYVYLQQLTEDYSESCFKRSPGWFIETLREGDVLEATTVNLRGLEMNLSRQPLVEVNL
jgi:hypothetical protein